MSHTPSEAFGTPSYGLTRHLPETSFADAVARTREALAAEGFGVLTEIDLRATLQAKLGQDLGRDYVILGACNPALAARALAAEPAIGLLLPCNVVVTSDADGATVSAIDPRAMFSVVDHPGLAPIADDVRARLDRALDTLGAAR